MIHEDMDDEVEKRKRDDLELDGIERTLDELERMGHRDPLVPEAVLPAHRAEDSGGEEGKFDCEMWIDHLPPNHLMTHLPKSHLCDSCLQAKLYEAPHRRRENQRQVLREAREVEDPKSHLDRISVDFVIASDLVG